MMSLLYLLLGVADLFAIGWGADRWHKHPDLVWKVYTGALIALDGFGAFYYFILPLETSALAPIEQMPTSELVPALPWLVVAVIGLGIIALFFFLTIDDKTQEEKKPN